MVCRWLSPEKGKLSGLCVPVLQHKYCHPSRWEVLSCARQMSMLGAGHVKQDMLMFLASELMYSVFLIINNSIKKSVLGFYKSNTTFL